MARFKVPVLVGGARVWRDMEEIDTSSAGAHANWPDRFFARLVDGYLAESNNTGGRVGDARAYLVSARALGRFARRWMEQIAADPGATDALARQAKLTESA